VLLYIALFIVMWIVGGFFYSYFVMQIILTLFTSVPLVKKCSASNAFNIKMAHKKIALTLLFNVIVVSAVFAIIVLFAPPSVKYGFAGGCGFTLLLSLGKWSWRKQDNFVDFAKSFRNCFNDEEAMVAVFTAINSENCTAFNFK